MTGEKPIIVYRCPVEGCGWWGEDPFWWKPYRGTKQPLCQVAPCPGVCEPYEAHPAKVQS